jgi:hypothetical protein
MHGGSEPHAEVNGMVELARRERTALGAPMDIEPQDGILECIRIAASEVREASDRIADLAPEDIETLATWSTIRHEAMDRFTAYCFGALRVGLEERLVRIGERQAMLIAHAVHLNEGSRS